VLKDPFSSSAPHLEGHHLSGHSIAPKAGAAQMANANAAAIQNTKDFFMSISSFQLG
jgi:hypothetical protein